VPAPIAGDAAVVGAAAPPATARLTRLTAPGCCVGPSWAADGQSVWFIDRPAPDLPAGLWSASVDAPGAAPRLVEPEVASYAPGLDFRIDVGEDDTTVTRRSDGAGWTLPTGGRPVSLSPDRQRAAWTASQAGVPNERQSARVRVAELGGGAPRELPAIPRGALDGWLDDDRLLVRGRESAQADEEVLWALGRADGQRREIARAERLRGELAAPGGRWVAYYVSQSAGPAGNGMWLASTDGEAPRKLDPALFGAYRWRDGERLLVVPLQADGASHRLLELDAATLAVRPLTDPAATPFKIANGDWAVSPDGRRVAFVEGADRALWVLELP
jgi:Tol biopolymer transport system component